MKIFERINVFPIFSSHFATFYDYGELKWTGLNRVPWQDKFTFIFFPLLLSLIFVFLNIKINEVYVSLIITAFSIFIGLLFNFLILVYGIAINEKQKLKNFKNGGELKNTNEIEVSKVRNEIEIKFKLSKELFVNIAYSISLSLLSIIFVFLTQFKPTIIIDLMKQYNLYNSFKTPYLLILNFSSIFLIFEFLLVLLMILKRFFIIFNKEFEM